MGLFNLESEPNPILNSSSNPGGPPPPPTAPGMPGADGLPTLPTWKPKEATKNIHFEQIQKNKLKETIFIKKGITAGTAKLQLELDELQSLFTNKKPKAEEAPKGKAKDEKPQIKQTHSGHWRWRRWWCSSRRTS
jgi:hypothetical protein